MSLHKALPALGKAALSSLQFHSGLSVLSSFLSCLFSPRHQQKPDSHPYSTILPCRFLLVTFHVGGGGGLTSIMSRSLWNLRGFLLQNSP